MPCSKEKRQVHGTLAGPNPGQGLSVKRSHICPFLLHSPFYTVHSELPELPRRLLTGTRLRDVRAVFVRFGRMLGQGGTTCQAALGLVQVVSPLSEAGNDRRERLSGTGLPLATASFRPTSALPSRVSSETNPQVRDESAKTHPECDSFRHMQ